ncbi:MAG: hypothetical protein ACFCVD_12690 [Nodosilinea sp.]
MASLTIRPGSRVRLKGQDSHVPDFFVVRCDHEKVCLRQPDWSPEAQLNVHFTQILVPDVEGRVPPLLQAVGGAGATAMLPSRASIALDNVIYMDAYRRKKAR